VVIKGNRATKSIDKTAYTFTSQQLKEARTGKDLMLNIPTLHISPLNNALTTVSGKSVMILINGVRATDNELSMLPPDKIKRVNFYDVPPLRYMDNADRVIDVETKDLDAGWAGNFYLMAAEFYNSATAAVSYLNGRNRFMLNVGGLYNPKRSVRDTEEGTYRYSVQPNNYAYDYLEESRSWTTQPSVAFTYTNSRSRDYVFQLTANFSGYWNGSDATRLSQYSKNNETDERTGLLTNKSHGITPTLDLYYTKELGKKGTLTANVVGTMYDTRQDAYSSETGKDGYEETLNLDINRKSLIGEVNYAYRLSRKLQFSLGYRGTFGFLHNKQLNSSGDVDERINTQKHFLYGEMTGQLDKWMYRLSLGGTQDVRAGADGFRNTTFTPLAMLGYRLSNSQSLRLLYRSNTVMPGVSSMTDNRILIMNDFYQTGNPQLQSSVNQTLSLLYEYSSSWLTISASVYGKENRRSLFQDFQAEANYMTVTTANAYRDRSLGGVFELTFTPTEWLEFGGSFEPVRQFFTPHKGDATYRYWSLPASVYLSLKYKSFTFDYKQNLGGHYLNGLYKIGYEKVSYLRLNYRYKQLQAGVTYYFPFIKDSFENSTLPETLVYNKAMMNMKSKTRTFGISLAWTFNTTKKREVYKNMQNEDIDRGTFEVK
jgi:hypothetical protein